MLSSYRTGAEYAQDCDRADPLAGFRDRFFMPKKADGSDVLYFCGNSLGLQPRSVADYIRGELDDWAALGVEGYFHARNPWVTYQDLVTASLARLVGAKPSEVVAMNSLTVNLHLMMVSFYRPTPQRFKILIERHAFPSDRHVVDSQARFHGFDPAIAVIESDDIEDILKREGSSIALVLVGGINYYTGRLFDIAAITKAGHAQGCMVGFDLAHAAGNVPLALHEQGVDFACWCSYKYMNAGPAGVGCVFVHERHAVDFVGPRFAGWWGHEESTRFLMKPSFTPMPGAKGWQLSNAPVFSMAALRASLALFDEAGMDALRAKSIHLTGYLEFLLDRIAGDLFEMITPRDPAQRGAQLSIVVHGNRGRAVFDGLKVAGVVCDWREPDCIRISLAPFYNSYRDVFDFVEIFLSLIHQSQAGAVARLARS